MASHNLPRNHSVKHNVLGYFSYIKWYFWYIYYVISSTNSYQTQQSQIGFHEGLH